MSAFMIRPVQIRQQNLNSPKTCFEVIPFSVIVSFAASTHDVGSIYALLSTIGLEFLACRDENADTENEPSENIQNLS